MAPELVNRSAFTSDLVEGLDAAELAALERNELPAAEAGSRELHATALGLELRAVQIMDGLQGLAGTQVGAATGVYLITTVVDGLGNEPIVFEGKTYRGIRNGDLLPLGSAHDPESAFTIYLREGAMPRLLSFQLLVLRSNAEIRELGAVFGEVRGDERYRRLAEIVTAALAMANPAFATIFQAANELLGLVGERLQATRDQQLAYYEARYTNAFHNLGVGRHPATQPTLPVGKIRFAYEISAMA